MLSKNSIIKKSYAKDKTKKYLKTDTSEQYEDGQWLQCEYFPNYAVSAAARAITVGFHYTVQLLPSFVHVLIGFLQGSWLHGTRI